MFNEVILKYGYPIISKEVSEAIYYARRIVPRESYPIRRLMLLGKLPSESVKNSLGLDKTKENMGSKSSIFNKKKWLPIARDMPFLVSHYCCNRMKKEPLSKYGKSIQSYSYIGTLTEESRVRKQAWLRHGCNAFDSKKITSQPLSFWTNQDILEYIKRFNLDMCSVYGEIETLSNGKLHCTGCQRTGCIFCGFSAHLDRQGEERFLMLKETHPKQYNYCIYGGQWSDNPYYDSKASTEPDKMGWVNWNPKKIWTPSREGLGMGTVFDMLNAEYGENFIRYK